MSETGIAQAEAYKGPSPFEDTENDRKLFFGRASEIDDLLNLVLSEPMVLLFGRSGLGKTSLINAGLKQRLREEGFFPIAARVPAGPGALSIADSVRREAGFHGFGIHSDVPEVNSAWDFFANTRFQKDSQEFRPVLILDQFEELFAGSASDPNRRDQITSFISDLTELVNGAPPPKTRQYLRRLVETEEPGSIQRLEALDQLFGRKAPDVKLVISIREDYLPELDDIRKRGLSLVFRSAYRLHPLTKDQARLAIEKPPQQTSALGNRSFLLAPGVADRMLRFLARERQRGKWQESDYVDPFLLQLLCQHLNRKLLEGRTARADQIIESDLGTDAEMQRVIHERYTKAVLLFERVRSPWSGRKDPPRWIAWVRRKHNQLHHLWSKAISKSAANRNPHVSKWSAKLVENWNAILSSTLSFFAKAYKAVFPEDYSTPALGGRVAPWLQRVHSSTQGIFTKWVPETIRDKLAKQWAVVRSSRFVRPRSSVRRLCEKELITRDQNRTMMSLDDILAKIGLQQKDLEKLVDLRIIRCEERLGTHFYELAHDTWIEPCLQAARHSKRAKRRGIGIALAAFFSYIVIGKALDAYHAHQRRIKAAEEKARIEQEAAKEKTQIELANALLLQARLEQASAIKKIIADELLKEGIQNSNIVAALNEIDKAQGLADPTTIATNIETSVRERQRLALEAEQRRSALQNSLAIFRNPDNSRSNRLEAWYEITRVLKQDNFTEVSLTNAPFEFINLTGLSFSNAVLDKPLFEGIEVENVDFSHTTVTSPHFENVQMQSVNFDGSHMSEPVFTNSQLFMVNLDNAVVAKPQFESTTLHTVSLRNGVIHNMDSFLDLYNCDWSGVSMNSNTVKGRFLVSLHGVTLKQAGITNTTFRDILIDETDFANAKLDNVLFDTVTFGNVSFRGTILKGIIFTNTSFGSADFTGARIIEPFVMHSATWWNAQGWPRQLVESWKTNNPPSPPDVIAISNRIASLNQELDVLPIRDLRLKLLIERADLRASAGYELPLVLDDTSTILSQDPKNLDALILRIRALLQMGRLDEAAKTVDSVDIADGGLEFMRGIISEQKNDKDEAAKHFRKSVDLKYHPRTQMLVTFMPETWWPPDSATVEEASNNSAKTH